MKRVFSFLLVAVMLASMLVMLFSCEEDYAEPNLPSSADSAQNGGEDEDLSAGEEDSETEPQAPVTVRSIDIVAEGVSEYVAVYPQYPYSADAYNAALSFVEAVKEATGVCIPICTDTETESYKESGHSFVLFGRTSFEASKKAYEALPSNVDAYSITNNGRDIVFIGRFDAALLKSVEYYKTSLLYENFDIPSNTVQFNGTIYDGEQNIITTFSFDRLKDYRIVYSSEDRSAYFAASYLQKLLLEKKGIKVTLCQDRDTVEVPYEILIGATNRELSRNVCADAERFMEYFCVVSQGKLQIVAGGSYSYKKCAIDIASIASETATETLVEGEHFRTKLTNVTVKITPGADLRVMSANLLAAASSSDNILPTDQRMEIFCGQLLNYTPDIIGVQEVDSDWIIDISPMLKLLEERYGISYKHIIYKHNGRDAWESMIYRADKYELNYSSFAPMSYVSPNATRYSSGISSAMFTSLSDPTQRIGLVNSHWHWEKENVASDPPKQYTDYVSMAEAVRTLQQMYPDAIVFATGDYNSHRFSGRYFNRFIWDVNGKVCSEIAREKGVLTEPGGCRTNHATMEEDKIRPMDDNFIDHIVGIGEFDVLRHTTITTNRANLLTDHSLIFADIVIK